MLAFWVTLTLIEKFFVYSAGLGSLFFIVRGISLCMGAFSGQGADLDGDGVPDALEQGGAGMADLDGDGIPDALEAGGMADLDGNGIPDALEAGGMADLDGNGIPDALQSAGLADLDHNGIPDVLEAANSVDLNGNGIPDALENLASSNGMTTSDSGNIDLDNHEIMVEKVPFFKQFLSIQNLSAFFMMLGWVGLAMMRSSGFGPIPATAAGILAGFVSASILMKVTNSLMKLSQTGTARTTSAIGKTGRVYLRIPADGDGQIEVDVDGRLKVCDAISADGTEIKTDSQVFVIDVKRTLEKDVLVVKEIKKQ